MVIVVAVVVVLVVCCLGFSPGGARDTFAVGMRWGQPFEGGFSQDQPDETATVILRGFNYSELPLLYVFHGQRGAVTNAFQLEPVRILQMDQEYIDSTYYLTIAKTSAFDPRLVVRTPEDVRPTIEIVSRDGRALSTPMEPDKYLDRLVRWEPCGPGTHCGWKFWRT